MVDGILNLCLTKEEEEEINITTCCRSDLLEECSLSLFGKIFSNRQQNQRALKNTLRSAWKMGSDLQIVDVGHNVRSSSLAQNTNSNGSRKMAHGISKQSLITKQMEKRSYSI